MAFKVRGGTPDFIRLQQILVQSKTQVENNPLYQVIKELLKLSQTDADGLSSLRTAFENLSSIIPPSGVPSTNQTFITSGDETSTLPNSRMLVAGSYVSIDLSVPGQVIVNGAEWSVLTDGDLIEPELIFASGDVIMLHNP